MLKNFPPAPFNDGNLAGVARTVKGKKRSSSTLFIILALFLFTGSGFIATVICAPGNANAAELSELKEVVTVTTSGAARLSSETPDIKKAAIEQALKNAVADVLESVIERERVDVDPTNVETEIYSNAVNFIKNYKVLSEERAVETVEAPAAQELTGEQNPADGAAPIDLQPVEVVTYRIWIEAAVDTTSLRAALGDLIFADDEFTKSISLVVLDLPDYAAYRSLLAALERITIIRSIDYDSFTAKRYAFTIDPAGSMKKLMRRITEEIGPGYIVTGTRKRTIIIKAEPTTISFNRYLNSKETERNEQE